MRVSEARESKGEQGRAQVHNKQQKNDYAKKYIHKREHSRKIVSQRSDTPPAASFSFATAAMAATAGLGS